ncbi:MAG TPA: hypothetical protein VHN16_11745 [Streptosporangiaceae bacterium]|nr:hypothetical protein [Streptosporangiaceae bacterium]
MSAGCQGRGPARSASSDDTAGSGGSHHEALELGDEGGGDTGPQVGVDAVLGGEQAELVQAGSASMISSARSRDPPTSSMIPESSSVRTSSGPSMATCTA